MIPPTCELFRALLRRALGGRSVVPNLALALASGAAAGWLAARYLGAGLGERPSAGVLAWLIVHFPQTALYGLGVLSALEITTWYGADARSGWPFQYLAAGGTRDRYVLALGLAGAAGNGLLYLLAIGAWLATALVLGQPASWLWRDTAFLPGALLWLLAPAGFAAAAVALTARAGRAVSLMAVTLLMPWLLLAAVRPDPEFGPPRWLAWTTAIAPPYPVAAGFDALAFIASYAAIAFAIAWVAAPGRVLRA